MKTDTQSTVVAFDRRQVYRPFLERLNSIASLRELEERSLIVPREHDPTDAAQPPIHLAFADAAELSRGSQIALVGGIGAGKTTELLLTTKTLQRHEDAINIFVDLADFTDLNEINTGAILATAGMRLYDRLKTAGEVPPEISSAHSKLRELAFGKRTWVTEEAMEPDYDEEPGVWVHTPGLVKLRFGALRREVKQVKELALSIASPLLEKNFQITLLIDGLDRLINPERFREFVEQDLRALRGTKITVIIVAPLTLWYDKSRFLQEYFDLVKHIPAAAASPQDSTFLKEILEKRGALELMDRSGVASIVKASGGVIRDLLTLAHSAAQYAYRDGEDRIGSRHIRAAVSQLGKRYLLGLGQTHLRILGQLSRRREFPVQNPTALELLVNRQVLEYSRGRRESFAVHPALEKVLPKPE